MLVLDGAGSSFLPHPTPLTFNLRFSTTSTRTWRGHTDFMGNQVSFFFFCASYLCVIFIAFAMIGSGGGGGGGVHIYFTRICNVFLVLDLVEHQRQGRWRRPPHDPNSSLNAMAKSDEINKHTERREKKSSN